MGLLLLLRRLHLPQISNRPCPMISLIPRRPFIISHLFLDQTLHLLLHAKNPILPQALVGIFHLDQLLRVKKHILQQAPVEIWHLDVLPHAKKPILPQALVGKCHPHVLSLNHHRAGNQFNLLRSQSFLKLLL